MEKLENSISFDSDMWNWIDYSTDNFPTKIMFMMMNLSKYWTREV